MMNSKTSESRQQMCRFLAEYAGTLLGCGATCTRIEKNVARIADAWHQEAVMTILPRHILLSLGGNGNVSTLTVPIEHCAISFHINTQLSRLSWRIADGETTFEEACTEYRRILRLPPANKWWTLLAASVANAAFCRIFGGDAAAMGVVLVATLAGYYAKQLLTSHGVDVRVMFILCAFISSVLGATNGLFHLGSTPDIAIGTSILYLVPGIPFLNSFSDMLGGHYICALSRLANALLLTGCLSIGLCAGMLLMNTGMF